MSEQKTIKISEELVDLWKDCPKITRGDFNDDKEIIHAIADKYAKFAEKCPDLNLIGAYGNAIGATLRNAMNKVLSEVEEALTVK